jgi:hypothetical protein
MLQNFHETGPVPTLELMLRSISIDCVDDPQVHVPPSDQNHQEYLRIKYFISEVYLISYSLGP